MHVGGNVDGVINIVNILSCSAFSSTLFCKCQFEMTPMILKRGQTLPICVVWWLIASNKVLTPFQFGHKVTYSIGQCEGITFVEVFNKLNKVEIGETVI